MRITFCRSDDIDCVREFLARQFPLIPQKADDRFFRWRFDHSPLGSSLRHYLLAWENGKLIGQLGALRDRLYVDGRGRDCVWLLDLIVAPEHRGRMAARRLFEEALKQDELMLAVGGGSNLLPFYQKLGGRLLPVAGTYFSVRRMSALLHLAEEVEGRLPMWKSLIPLMHPGLRLTQWVGCAWHRDSRVRVVEIPCFGPETDVLIEEVLPLLGVTTHRSASTLNWKFFERPEGRHFVLVARAADGRLRGYAAVKLMRRGEVRWGEIVDVLGHPGEPDVFRTLVSVSVRRCLSFHADFVRLRCSHPAQTVLLRAPFWVRRNRHVIDDVLFWTRDQDLTRSLMETPWHLTSVVSDRTDHGADEWYADAAATEVRR